MGSSSLFERQLEALLFASPEPVIIQKLYDTFDKLEVDAGIASLSAYWETRGMRLQVKAGAASFVPSPAHVRVLTEVLGGKSRAISAAAIETLCFIAVHQPVSINDIERARGLKLYKGVIDSLLDAGLIRSSVRRTDAGRAVAYVTTDAFLDHFGLSSLMDIPTAEELVEMGQPFTDEMSALHEDTLE